MYSEPHKNGHISTEIVGVDPLPLKSHFDTPKGSDMNSARVYVNSHILRYGGIKRF